MVRRQIIFLLILIFLLSNKVSSQDSFTDQSLLENDDGTYKIELITSNVEYTVMDLVKYERLIEEGISIKSARNQSTHYDELYNLVFGNAILISAYSIEGDHKIYLEELGIGFNLTSPSTNENVSNIIMGESYLPSVDTSIIIKCTFDCQPYHENLSFILHIGDGHLFEKQDIDIISNINLWYMLGLTSTVIIGILFISIIKPFDFIKRRFFDG
ncbi:hypothetical protein EB155_06335 [archaeon]|nr:hypothetical protein [archaeon]NDB79466.1 hypothetical protein [archaeon]